MIEMTLYLACVPTNDTETRKLWPRTKKRDVIARRAPDGPEIARWPWWASGRPRRNHRRVWMNCFRYRAQWVQ